MHGRIFQLELNPVPRSERIDSSDIPGWFSYISDFTDDCVDVEYSTEWLLKGAIGNVASLLGDKLVFDEWDVRRRYFVDKYKKFVKAAGELSSVAFDDFISTCGVDMIMRRLSEAYDDKYGFYVFSEGELCTLDDFMRTVKDGETYYLGGIVDYHY